MLPLPALKNYIAVEGFDGIGKTELLNRIQAYLESKGVDVSRTREPGGSPVAEDLRTILKTKVMSAKVETLLMSAARADMAETIRSALLADRVVLADRCDWSTFAYQGLSGHVTQQQIEWLSSFAVREIQPGLVILLDAPVDTVLARRAARGEETDALEAKYLSKMEEQRQVYLRLARIHEHRAVVINAALSADEVFSIAKVLVDGYLAQSKSA